MSGRVVSHLCQVTFRISDEERIVELPERPPPPETSSRASSGDPNTTSKPRQQKSKTSSPSESPLREEDLFQRFHIIREITTIEGRPQSKLQQMAGKAVEKGDVIGLKALLERSCEYDDDAYLLTAAREDLPLEAFRILIAAGEDVRANGFWGKHRYTMRQTSTLRDSSARMEHMCMPLTKLGKRHCILQKTSTLRDSSSRMERLCTPLPIPGEHHCIQLRPLESLKP
jgi:hypothetical protein